MLKKTVTYTDYNGVERTEDFYFNLSKAELHEMAYSKEGGLAEYVNRIIAAQDTRSLVELFKELVLKAYGEKSADGKRFKKVNEKGMPLYIDFSETEAYSIIYMELATDDKAASNFVNHIVPKDLELQDHKPSTTN